MRKLWLNVFCWAVISTAAGDWADDFYQYRIPVRFEIPAPGTYELQIDAAGIIERINENEIFKYDVNTFAYPNLRLAVDGKLTEARYQIKHGRELVKNGDFARLKNPQTPEDWGYSSNAAAANFKIVASESGNVVESRGASRHSLSQIIPTGNNKWYYFSYKVRGISAPAPMIQQKNDVAMNPVPGSYHDPYLSVDNWTESGYYFYTGDKSNWTSDRLAIQILNFDTDVAMASLKECEVAFTAEFARAGKFTAHLYYVPLEGPSQNPPALTAGPLPEKKIPVEFEGRAELNSSHSVLAANGAGTFWSAPTTAKIHPDMKAPVRKSREITIYAARNEQETVQLVFSPAKDVEVTGFEVSVDGLAAEHIRLFNPQYVTIDTPSSYAMGRRIDPGRSTYTGKLPDPMPVFAPAAAKAGENFLLWFEVAVPANAKVKSYSGKVKITTTGGVAEIPLKLNVWNFALPEKSSFHTMLAFDLYANQFLFPFHKAESREDKYQLSRAYTAEMARYRLNAKAPTSAGVYLPDVRPNNTVAASFFKIYETELPWALNDLKLNYYILRHYSGRQKHTEETAEKEAAFMDELAAFLDSKGLLKGGIALVDEPMISEYGYLKILRDAYRSKPHAAKIPFLCASYHGYSYEKIQGLTDILAVLDNENYSTVSRRGRELLGNVEFWTYLTRSCTLWIDTPGINNRFMAARNWADGSRGLFIWGTNIWWSRPNDPHKQFNPWENPLSSWGNGAVAFFYPPCRTGNASAERDMTITPSLRLTLYRDGIEDYEYAVILDSTIKKAESRKIDVSNARKLLEEYNRQFPTPQNWNVNDLHWAKLRLRIGDEIEKLQDKL